MNYEVGTAIAPQEPRENMTDVLHDTANIAGDLLGMSRRIKTYLFGEDHTPCSDGSDAQKRESPSCVRDEMVETRCILKGALDEMYAIGAQLGALCSNSAVDVSRKAIT